MSAVLAGTSRPVTPPPPLPPLPGQQLSSSAYDCGLSAEVTRCGEGAYHVRVSGPPGGAFVLHWVSQLAPY